MIVSNLQVF